MFGQGYLSEMSPSLIYQIIIHFFSEVSIYLLTSVFCSLFMFCPLINLFIYLPIYSFINAN